MSGLGPASQPTPVQDFQQNVFQYTNQPPPGLTTYQHPHPSQLLQQQTFQNFQLPSHHLPHNFNQASQAPPPPIFQTSVNPSQPHVTGVSMPPPPSNPLYHLPPQDVQTDPRHGEWQDRAGGVCGPDSDYLNY